MLNSFITVVANTLSSARTATAYSESSLYFANPTRSTVSYPSSSEAISIGLPYSEKWDLHTAAARGDEAAVLSFLEGGANINSFSDYGETPLTKAARAGHAKIVKILLERGADPAIALLVYSFPLVYETPLSCASQKGHTEVVKLLLLSLEKTNKADHVPLHYAVRYGDIEIVRALLEAGADINKLNGAQNSALELAVYHNRPDIVALLLENGADADHDNSYGTSAMAIATNWGFKESIIMLLEKGARVKHNDIIGCIAALKEGLTYARYLQGLAEALGQDPTLKTPIYTSPYHLLSVKDNILKEKHLWTGEIKETPIETLLRSEFAASTLRGMIDSQVVSPEAVEALLDRFEICVEDLNTAIDHLLHSSSEDSNPTGNITLEEEDSHLENSFSGPFPFYDPDKGYYYEQNSAEE